MYAHYWTSVGTAEGGGGCDWWVGGGEVGAIKMLNWGRRLDYSRSK